MLVLNCGSQSIKWKLFYPDLNIKKEGHLKILGNKNFEKGLIGELGKIKKLGEEINIIGHRVVHSGGKLKSPLTITSKNLKELEKFNNLAPLHNPFNILGIKFSQSVFPKAKQLAFFDTSFFAELPERAFIYALPEKLQKMYGIRRFGFHGISHEFAASEAAKITDRPVGDLNIITCHLGGGSSIAAIKNGKAIDTSMGFTPMEGLVMMTRGGDIDPGLIFYLNKKVKNLESVLNYESGVKGLCGLSEMLDVLKAVEKGSKKAKLALDIFVYSVQKYIGAYFAVLGKCDLLVFTGSIGAGSKKIVDMICNDLSILKDTKVLQIKDNESLAIAQKIKNL